MPAPTPVSSLPPGGRTTPTTSPTRRPLTAAIPTRPACRDLGRLEHGLDHAFRAYHKRAGIPIYITEWGVQSRDPNPFIKFSQAQQAEYLNEGEYMAFRNPRVKSFAQFLLVDDAPNTTDPVGSRAYWSTFDSGLLLYGSNQPKPAYYAFELPLWLPNPRHGNHVYVWAQIRPTAGHAWARCNSSVAARPRGPTSRRSRGQGPEGYVSTHVALPSAGSLRLSWTAGGQTRLQPHPPRSTSPGRGLQQGGLGSDQIPELA